ncbi:MAG TPA: nucleotidyltransferase family protein [Chloroflexota bacterium]
MARNSDSMLAETEDLIRADSWRMDCLRAVRSLQLPDWYIGAGFVRNAIWDALHEKPVRTPLNDVDLIYFDRADRGAATEARLEGRLTALMPDVVWQVRDQARMHIPNQHPPYRDSAHAIAHWPETQTCVGVRLETADTLTIVAPYGLAENWSLRVTPNPEVPYPVEVFNQRVRGKRWLEIWPRLQVHWASDGR